MAARRECKQLFLSGALVLCLLALSLLPATKAYKSLERKRGYADIIEGIKQNSEKRFYTTKDLMRSIMNFYSGRRTKPQPSLDEYTTANARKPGADDEAGHEADAKKRGVSVMELKHMNNSFDEEMCRKVCQFCKSKLSMRWAALCHAQCRQGGNEYNACVVIWHEMYSGAMRRNDDMKDVY